MVSVPGPSCRPSVQGVNPPVCCVLDAAVIYARDSSCRFLRGPFVLSRGGGGQTCWHQAYNIIVIITDILYVFIVYDDVIIVYSALLSVPSVLCRTSDEISPATGASDENIIIMKNI